MYAPGPALRQHPTATDLTTAEAPSAPAPRNTPRSSTRSSAPTERSTRAHNAEHAHANPSDRITRQGARTHPGTPDPTWPDHPESHHPRYQPAQQKEWSHINPRTTAGRYHEPTRERSSPVVLGQTGTSAHVVWTRRYGRTDPRSRCPAGRGGLVAGGSDPDTPPPARLPA